MKFGCMNVHVPAVAHSLAFFEAAFGQLDTGETALAFAEPRGCGPHHRGVPRWLALW
jgi:hypothetical protein